MAIQIWIPLAEAVAVLLVTCFLVYKHADMKRTNNFSLAITTLSWFLSFSMIFFIPLDIYVVSDVMPDLVDPLNPSNRLFHSFPDFNSG